MPIGRHPPARNAAQRGIDPGLKGRRRHNR
jgi:hypothetical protein